MNAYEIVAVVILGLILCCGFAAIYLSIQIHNDEKAAAKREEESWRK